MQPFLFDWKIARGGIFRPVNFELGRKWILISRFMVLKNLIHGIMSTPNALTIGHRNRANEIFYESPLLQTEDSRKYASLPTGHPIGYNNTIYNFFMDYYSAAAAKRNGKKAKTNFPDLYAGHSEMQIIEAAIRSSQTGGWEKL